tara:strand:+ start:441 stop:1082 length:642 start_codon:yes stop_codon:yes gene_type:complete
MIEIRKRLEQYILGACIVEGSAIESLQFLTEKNFTKYEFDHKIIFSVLKEMSGKTPIDIVTVAYSIFVNHGFDYMQYVLDLCAPVTSHRNVQYHSACLLQIDMKEKFLSMVSTLSLDHRIENYDRALLSEIIQDVKTNDIAMWDILPASIRMCEKKQASKIIIDELISFNKNLDIKIKVIKENIHVEQVLHQVYQLCKTDFQKYQFNQLKESL